MLLQASPAGIFSLLGGVYLWVPRDCKRETVFCSYGNRLPYIPPLQLLWCLFCLFLSWPCAYWSPDWKHRDDKGQLLLGIRRANRQQMIMPSSVLSSDSMHIGVLAAANHAAATNSRFTIFYNPRLVTNHTCIVISCMFCWVSLSVLFSSVYMARFSAPI